MSKRTESRDAARAGMGRTIGRSAAFAAAACALALAASAAGGERAVNELAKLTDPDGFEWDHFGSHVAVDGDVAVVGAPGAGSTGLAFVFRFDGAEWVLEARLEPKDTEFADDFGCGVAIEGDTILVGDWHHSELGNAAGAAYIFTFDGSEWTEEAKLQALDAGWYDYFGYAVALAGDVVIIGAPEDDDLGESSGSVYVFRPAGGAWEQKAKLHASDGQTNYCFGRAVAVSGDRFIAGGRQKYGDGTAGYVFRFDGESWLEEAILLPEEVVPDDMYGACVAIDGNVALVSASGDPDGAKIGAVYVFRHDGASWNEETKLLSGEGAEGDRFGSSVAVHNETIVIGANSDDEYGEDSGSAYAFTHDGAEWLHHSKLLPSDGAPDARFGGDVAISGDLVLVGAPGDDDHGENSGSAYIFSASQPDEDCNENGVPDYLDIANGTSQDCNENAIPDECDLADGTSEDCNGNDIPDECDIADLMSWDCNQNGIPDECDIASGYSEDVNGDGIPDECLPPGEGGVIPLLQTRTLHVRASDLNAECQKEEFDEALDFSPYENSISVTCGCGHGSASQDSYVRRADIHAVGSAHATGAGGGGSDCSGMGQSVYQVVFGAPYAESTLLSGQISVQMSLGGDPYPVESRVALLDFDEQTLFEVELISEEETTIKFHESVDLEEGMTYSVRAEAYVVGATWGFADGTAEFVVELNALGDVDGYWDVDTADLLALLAAWGPNEGHPADFNGDGTVNTQDLLTLLGNWGP